MTYQRFGALLRRHNLTGFSVLTHVMGTQGVLLQRLKSPGCRGAGGQKARQWLLMPPQPSPPQNTAQEVWPAEDLMARMGCSGAICLGPGECRKGLEVPEGRKWHYSPTPSRTMVPKRIYPRQIPGTTNVNLFRKGSLQM